MAGVLSSDGLPASRVETLELPWPEVREPAVGGRDSVLYFGRVEKEKGVFVALEAWAKTMDKLPQLTMRIAGTGSAIDQAREIAAGLSRVEFLGYLDPAGVARELDRSVMTVHPSLCNENSPFSVRESLCAGVPAIVSRIGGMPELVDETTGTEVTAGDAAAWADAIVAEADRAIAGSASILAAVAARRLSPEHHLRALVAAYRAATNPASKMATPTQAS
jgi:glycosyltransferase involved in cell wall biosynthesis